MENSLGRENNGNGPDGNEISLEAQKIKHINIQSYLLF